MFFFFKSVRRKKLRQRPFPEGWDAIIREKVAADALLPEADRQELREHVLVFLDEKRFEGCGGLELSDEVLVTIAAQACVLLLHRETEYFPKLRSVLVYPDTIRGSHQRQGEVAGTVDESETARLGESWTTGSVVLSWRSVLRGGDNPEDGHNVVLHEFAHQLDAVDGAMDGAPVLGKGLGSRERRQRYADWSKTLQAGFDRLQKRTEAGRRTVLDPYGATNPAEFFAVATETFFEKPERMAREHADLFHALQAYYRIDPRDWSDPRAETGSTAS